MTLLGLLDWILICIVALLIELGVICFAMMLLSEWVSFKPSIHYRPSTRIEDSEGNVRIIEAPRNYHEHYYNRGEKLKWYHKMIFGP